MDIRVKSEEPMTLAGRFGCVLISSTGKVVLVGDKWSIFLRVNEADVEATRALAVKGKGSLYIAIEEGKGYILEEG